MNKKICEIGYIQKLSKFYPGDYIEISDELMDAGRNSYFERQKIFIDKLGEKSNYFFGNSHDSEIMNISKIGCNLYLLLNDIATIEFAYAFSKVYCKQMPERKLEFPLTMCFCDVNHFSVNTVSKTGKIRRDKNLNISYISSYLYEEFYSVENEKIELSLNVWGNSARRKHNRFLLLLSCKNIDISHSLRENWISIFGIDSVNVFDKYLIDRMNGEYFSDYSACEKYLIKKKNV